MVAVVITFTESLDNARRYMEGREPLSDETLKQRVLLHAVCEFLRSHGATRDEVDAFIDLKASVEVEAEQIGWSGGWDAGYEAGQKHPRITA